MSYKCTLCNKITLGSPSLKILKTREKKYTNILKRGRKVYTKESKGWEIEKEVNTCKGCYGKQ